MRDRKRLICSVPVLFALSLLLLVACVPQIGFAPTPEPVTLRFAYREHTVELQNQFDAFQEKYPWITIEATQARRWGNQMEMMIKSGSVDIFRDGRQAFAYAREGLLKPLDDIQLGDWADIRDDYYKGAWEGLSIRGQQWGIPAGMDMLVVYVNMDQARALKVKIPEAEWSLLDFIELTTELNYPEGLPHAEAKLYGFCTTTEGIDPIVFIYMHGGKIVDNINAPSEATLDDPLTVEAIQWYSDLTNRHDLVPDPNIIRTTFRQGGIYEAQVRGACGAWFGWYSSRGGGDTSFRWRVDWKMLPLPRERTSFGLGDVEGYFITEDCTHPKEALKLIRFLSNGWEAAGQRLPARRSLVEDEGYEDAVGEDVAAIARGFSDNVLMLPVEMNGGLEQVGSVLFSAIKEIVSEDLDAADVMGEAQQKVQAVFQ